MSQVTAIVGPGPRRHPDRRRGRRLGLRDRRRERRGDDLRGADDRPQHPHRRRLTRARSSARSSTACATSAPSGALLGSFVIDLFAMTFGMPRALFVVLSLHVFHAGAAGTGLLYASVSLRRDDRRASTNGWLTRARRLGRITIAMVLIWGAAIAVAGTATSIVLAAVLLAVAGAADCDQRRLPHDDRAARHDRGDARAHELGLRPRRDGRRAPRRHRVGHRRGAHARRASRGRQRRPRLHRGRRRRAARVPGLARFDARSHALGPTTRGAPRRRTASYTPARCRPRQLRDDHRRVGRARLRPRRAPGGRRRRGDDRLARRRAGRGERREASSSTCPGATVTGLAERAGGSRQRARRAQRAVPQPPRDARPHRRGRCARGSCSSTRPCRWPRAVGGKRDADARRLAGLGRAAGAGARSRRRRASSARCTPSARRCSATSRTALDEDVLLSATAAPTSSGSRG